VRFDKPCFVAIPSTSGTGSEVTNFSVITANGAKNVLIDEFIAPDIALLDSICIQHVPPAVIADTGIDVLVHALEAYVSTDATDFTDALAEKAAELIFAHLKSLYDDPADDNARDRVQNASCIAGIAFTNANLGITHSLAHALGAQFHLPHGRANAMMVESVIAFNADLSGTADNDAAWKYQKMAEELNLPSRTPREGTVSLIRHIRQLKQELGMPRGIQETGKVDPTEFERAVEHMAQEALRDRCTPTNPVQPTKDDLIRLYRESF
jgi:alcohol dehydrogenase class IV